MTLEAKTEWRRVLVCLRRSKCLVDVETLKYGGMADQLYDAELDQEDADWVLENLRVSGRVSDAVLSCPACFTTLCLDCQQHELFKNQFRAMFVMNCHVDSAAWVRPISGDEDSTASFHPVFCRVCATEVAAVEHETEVFHFFSVLPSQG